MTLCVPPVKPGNVILDLMHKHQTFLMERKKAHLFFYPEDCWRKAMYHPLNGRHAYYINLESSAEMKNRALRFNGNNMNNIKYYASAISAFFIWGFFSFALKPIANYESLDILFYRVFFSTAIVLFLTLLVRITVLRETISFIRTMSSKELRKLIFQTLAAGIFLAFNWFFFIYVVNQISIKAASFAYVVSPILTTVLAFIFLKEKLTRTQWLAVALSGLSCLILSLGDFAHVIYSLITALAFSMYQISQPKNKGIDKFMLLTVQIVCSAVLLTPFYPRYSSHIKPEFTFYIYITVIAIFFTVIPLFLNLYALKELKSSTVGMLFFINPILNFIIAILYYHEKITMLQGVGYSVIVLSVVLFNISWIGGTNKYITGNK